MSRSPSAARLNDALLTALVDDAAIFPPGNAELERAVVEHRQHRAATYAPCVGPLLVRTADAEALAALLRPAERLGVALVVRPGVDPSTLPAAIAILRAQDRADVRALELPLAGADPSVVAGDLGIPLWLEVTLSTLEHDLDAIAAASTSSATPIGAKLRTGGLHPTDFPTERQLATFLAAAVRRDLRVKLTAGLHHAARNRDEQHGFEQHGVLNVLLCTALLRAGNHEQPDFEGAEQALAQRDGTALATAVRALDVETALAVRGTFGSFGCCGVSDPLDEIAALGLSPALSTSTSAAPLEDLS